MAPARPIKYVVYASGTAFVARCVDFDIVAAGDSEDDALDNLLKAIHTQSGLAGSGEGTMCASPMKLGELTMDPTGGPQKPARLRQVAVRTMSYRFACQNPHASLARRRCRLRARRS